MSDEKKLFDRINKIGEYLSGTIHIIDLSEDDLLIKYRIYHEDGHCIDITREYVCDPAEINEYEGVEEDGFCYSFFAEWEGFHYMGITGINILLDAEFNH